MDTSTATLFFAMLSVLAELAVVWVLAILLASRWSSRAARIRDELVTELAGQALWFACFVAAVCMFGSLYLSEVAHFTPCRLCWYQRVVMYSLVPTLALFAWRQWTRAWWVVCGAAVFGGVISSWHIMIERFPTLETGSCDPTNPCSLIWVRRFGYLTIPTMALSGFALIATLALLFGRAGSIRATTN